MEKLKLIMVLVGCTPKGRNTEQHDVFFGIGTSLGELVPAMKAFWPEAKGKIHIDAWREVTHVEEYHVSIELNIGEQRVNGEHLFFVNLGGYLPGVFDEQHYKVLTIADSLSNASIKAKKNIFYKTNSFKGATAHIDDKYGIDVDDAYFIRDILNTEFKNKYQIVLKKSGEMKEDVLHIGYIKIADLIQEQNSNSHENNN